MNGSSRAPKRDEVRRTPFATARTLPWRAAEHRDDAVRFTQLVGAQDHDLVAVGGHPPIMVADSPTRTRAEPCETMGAWTRPSS